MKPIIILFIAAMTISSCAKSQTLMHVNPKAQQLLMAFVHQSKFDAIPNSSFNGLSNPKLKPQLNFLINQAAKDFLHTAAHQATEAKFQSDIANGLKRFDKYALQLDTEDRERICEYFEELMDCVGLQSSNGQLNTWMYGFDPNKAGH